jgi:hypothetical protein
VAGPRTLASDALNVGADKDCIFCDFLLATDEGDADHAPPPEALFDDMALISEDARTLLLKPSQRSDTRPAESCSTV